MIETIKTLQTAMRNSDRVVCDIQYRDKWGDRTERTISPIRIHGKRVVALCLGREEPRTFEIARIESISMRSADDVLMPETIRKQR